MVPAPAGGLRNMRRLAIASEVAVQARRVESAHVKGSAYHGFFEAHYRTGVRGPRVDGVTGSLCLAMVWRVENNEQGLWDKLWKPPSGRWVFRQNPLGKLCSGLRGRGAVATKPAFPCIARSLLAPLGSGDRPHLPLAAAQNEVLPGGSPRAWPMQACTGSVDP